jgi:hypothetical protein
MKSLGNPPAIKRRQASNPDVAFFLRLAVVHVVTSSSMLESVCVTSACAALAAGAQRLAAKAGIARRDEGALRAAITERGGRLVSQRWRKAPSLKSEARLDRWC